MKLTDYFNSINSDYFVIGATARDIIFSGIHKLAPKRRTVDLDIAIAIKDWDKFKQISEDLQQIDGFRKEREQKQMFWYKNQYRLDIVPFGEIAEQDNTIYWPPEEEFAMSVVGYSEVANHTLAIVIDDDFQIKVASLPGIFILKLNAFVDMKYQTNKHADDLGFVIDKYLDINLERAVQKHYDLYLEEDYNPFIAGATLLGRDIAHILQESEEATILLSSIIKKEIELNEESLLFNQIIETHKHLKFEEVTVSFERIYNQLNHGK